MFQTLTVYIYFWDETNQSPSSLWDTGGCLWFGIWLKFWYGNGLWYTHAYNIAFYVKIKDEMNFNVPSSLLGLWGMLEVSDLGLASW